LGWRVIDCNSIPLAIPSLKITAEMKERRNIGAEECAT
jgi:hypothetical protein